METNRGEVVLCCRVCLFCLAGLPKIFRQRLGVVSMEPWPTQQRPCLGMVLLIAGQLGHWQVAGRWRDGVQLCWEDSRHSPTECPPGLSMKWVAGFSPGPKVPAGTSLDLRIQMGLTSTMLEDLEKRHLLRTGVSADWTAADQWSVCTNSSSQSECEQTQEDCCLFNVNALLCVDLPGVACEPFSDHGPYVKRAIAQEGYLDEYGKATFNFTMKVFWSRPHTILVHASLGKLQWAIGSRIKVDMQKKLCGDHLVPALNGSCESCPRGWQPTDGRRPPQAVEATVSNKINPYCVPCQPGEHSTNGGICKPCHPGQYQRNWGQRRCRVCPPGRTAPGHGARRCTPCPRGTYSSQAGGRVCRPCPRGAACPEGQRAVALPGFYSLPDQEEDEFLACQVAGACVGGDGNHTCRKGMTGFLCDQCVPGWTKSEDGLCHRCSDFYMSLLWALFVVFAYALYVMLMVRLKTAAGMRRVEVKSVILKIVCNYLFLATISWRVLPKGVSDQLRDLFNVVGLALLEPQTLVSLQCMVDPERGDRYNFIVVCMALVLIPLVCAVAWLLVICGFLMFRVKLPKSVKGWLETMTPILLVIAFVLHPMVTKVFIRFSLTCVDIEGYRLEADLDVICFKGSHTTTAFLCFVGLFVWSLGLPLAFFIVLRRYRRKLMQPRVRHMLGFLYNGYEHRCYHFEVFFMLRKVVVLFAVSLKMVDVQVILLRLLVIAIVSLVVQCKVSPFDNRSWNLLDTLETANLVAFTITLLVAITMQTTHTEPEMFLGKVMIVGSHLAYLWLVMMALARPLLVRVLNNYCRCFTGTIRHKIFKYMHVAAGQIHAFPDGSLDVSGLNSFERGYLGTMLGEALEELCCQKALAVLQHSRLRQMIKVATADIFSRRAESRAGTPQHVFSYDGSWKCSGKILSMFRGHVKALIMRPTPTPHISGRRLSMVAEEAAMCIEDQRGDTFSLEELQEALMDVLDNVCSGALIVDEIGASDPLSPSLRSNTVEDSDFVRRMCSVDVSMEPTRRMCETAQELASCESASNGSMRSTTVEDLLASRSSDGPSSHFEAKPRETCASLGSTGSDWRSRTDTWTVSPIDEVLALIDVTTVSLPALSNLVEPHAAGGSSNSSVVMDQPHLSYRPSHHPTQAPSSASPTSACLARLSR